MVDLFEVGDRDALTAAIAEHERLAAELRLPSFAWYVPMWRATLALLGGRLEEAQRLSEQGRASGASPTTRTRTCCSGSSAARSACPVAICPTRTTPP